MICDTRRRTDVNYIRISDTLLKAVYISVVTRYTMHFSIFTLKHFIIFHFKYICAYFNTLKRTCFPDTHVLT